MYVSSSWSTLVTIWQIKTNVTCCFVNVWCVCDSELIVYVTWRCPQEEDEYDVRGCSQRTWDDDFVLKRQFSALIPAFDPRPGRTNVNQTQDFEVPAPGSSGGDTTKKVTGMAVDDDTSPQEPRLLLSLKAPSLPRVSTHHCNLYSPLMHSPFPLLPFIVFSPSQSKPITLPMSLSPFPYPSLPVPSALLPTPLFSNTLFPSSLFLSSTCVLHWCGSMTLWYIAVTTHSLLPHLL